ncbi:hypothetical protein [[Phormidium] sp. LEGE 05292]|uniref:hypothetical protein n=1 Tax=[Phormidium] sp. LEGE 05292 TaxID=767427 RepID=UPI001881340F|nr:hypothetical protein [Phormidium sp. LEGE 05292]
MINNLLDSKIVTEAWDNLELQRVLAERELQYQDANPEEILDLLAEAVDSYTFVAAALSQQLRQIAREEMKFLLSVYEASVIKAPSPTTINFLFYRACKITNEILLQN